MVETLINDELTRFRYTKPLLIISYFEINDGHDGQTCFAVVWCVLYLQTNEDFKANEHYYDY